MLQGLLVYLQFRNAQAVAVDGVYSQCFLFVPETEPVPLGLGHLQGGFLGLDDRVDQLSDGCNVGVEGD